MSKKDLNDNNTNATDKEKYEHDTKWLFNTSMSYLKITVASLVLLGGLSVGIFFISKSDEVSKIANYILLGISVF